MKNNRTDRENDGEVKMNDPLDLLDKLVEQVLPKYIEAMF